MMRDELVRLARLAAAGAHRPSYCDDPASFDPHEWVLEAMQRAYEEGLVEGAKLEAERPF
jgi:hypothetical protein